MVWLWTCAEYRRHLLCANTEISVFHIQYSVEVTFLFFKQVKPAESSPFSLLFNIKQPIS